MRSPQWVVARSGIAMAGAALTTISAVLFIIFFALDAFGVFRNPYIGLLIYVALPAAFVAGLLLVPLGSLLAGRRERMGWVPAWPVIDFNEPRTRRAAAVIAVATAVNIVIISMASYGAVHYMETPSFCGRACHTVMQPQFVAYQNGPHARVPCVECHVGGGATSFARAKLTGVRQLAHLTSGRYPRPILGPVRNMRPARDTCEQCHWPGQFHGDKIRVVREYATDRPNTETSTTLRVHVGGGIQNSGIHWHMNLANEVEYIATDEKRQVIPYVRLTDTSGNVREYVAPGVTPEQLAAGERRRMDCIDCHSRPSHSMTATAERAVDRAIAAGAVDRTLPFARREAVKALKVDYPSQDEGAAGIEKTLRDFYATQPAVDRAGLDRSIASAVRLYRTNVFPSMRVTWGTYVDNIGHIDTPGCFRCHDDQHKTQGGKTIGQDCESCHTIE